MRKTVENNDSSVPCVGGQQRNKKRFPSRWSLRHLIYSSPLLNRRRSPNMSGPTRSFRRDVADKGGPSKDVHRAASHEVEIHQATSKTSVFTASTKSGEVQLSMECPLCFAELSSEEFWELSGCGHRACLTCLKQYLRVEISESRVCISCPECTEPMHPNEIRGISNDILLYEKYEDFMVRRVLAVEPDTRWCPAPDCGFAVIASECASCPKLKCMRPGCDSSFCYHCKAEWHPNQTCDAARAQRSPNIRSSSIAYSQDSQHRDDIKPCPRCQVLIVKMDDGSCNHMMCAVCGAEFCWLCMKEISDLHYLSPSGCTFWGKKPWSRKKKILWQLGTLVGAPVGIALVAGITVPAMIIGIPVWVGRKLYTRYKTSNKHKRNAAIAGGVIASVMISPILAGLAVGIGVPILLFYVYGVVPVSLCRSGGCGGSSSSSPSPSSASSSASDDSALVNSTKSHQQHHRRDTASLMDAVSVTNHRLNNPSIGEASLASGSQVMLREADRESASTVALAGSVGGGGSGSGATANCANAIGCGVGPTNNTRLEVHADMTSTKRFSISSESAMNGSLGSGGDNDGAASVRAMAGSMLHYKTNGSDSCSCAEDCGSERVRFDDTVGYSNNAEKTSIGSSCSFRARCTAATSGTAKSSFTRSDRVYDSQSNDAVYVDIEPSGGEKPKKSQTALLRSQFFYSNFNEKNTGEEDQVIVELATEKQAKRALITTDPSSSAVIQPSYV